MYIVPMFQDLNFCATSIPSQQDFFIRCANKILTKKKKQISCDLNELAWELSLYILLRNAKVKALSVVEWEFQAWQVELFTVFVSKVMYSCQFNLS